MRRCSDVPEKTTRVRDGDAASAKRPYAAAGRRRLRWCDHMSTQCEELIYVLQSEHTVLSYYDWESKLPPKED